MRYSFSRLVSAALPCRKLLGSIDAGVAARLRASQIQTLISLSPLMMVANVLLVVALIILLSDQPMGGFLYFWAMMVCLAGVIGLESYRRNRVRENSEQVSERAVVKSARSALYLGLLWGLLPLIYLPAGDSTARLLVSVFIVGMLGGGAMSLYVVPSAMVAYLLAMLAGSLAGLALSGTLLDLGLALVLAGYVGLLIHAGSTMAATYARSVISSIKLNENAETIRLLLRDFSEGSSDWLWQVTAQDEPVYGSDRFTEHLGLSLRDILRGGRDVSASASVAAEGIAALWHQMAGRQPFTDLVVSSEIDGERNWVSLSGKPLHDADGEFSGYRGVASDITEARRSEERIAFLAHNDALTGLVNRTNFNRQVSDQFSTRNSPFWAVLFLDLDGFKQVNDRRGHAAGDSLLEAVALRLREQVREGDLVSRLGGDEFAILCRSAGNSEALSAIAERIICALSAPYELDGGHRITGVGVSIGIAIGGRDGSSQRELLNNADLALYRSKSEGKNTFRFFEMEMDEVVRSRRSLEHDLREAVRNNAFSLAYQPVVAAGNGTTVGFEALLRWNHPKRGEVPPSVFVPIAESMGLISGVGGWVIREACRQAAAFPDDLRIAVNLSPQQFRLSNVVQSVTAALEQSGLDPSRLELEITEGLFMENTEEVSAVLAELKAMGISIALDDFGTGYSSLSYLLRFPFDKLKIDRSFIAAIDTDPVVRDVLESIARLGRVLDLRVTAEGIETVEQLDALNGLDCSYFQGFLFGKPLSSNDIPEYLASEALRIESQGLSLERRFAQRRNVPGRREEDLVGPEDEMLRSA